MDDISRDIDLEELTGVITESLLKLAINPVVQTEVPGLDHYAQNLMSAMEEGDLASTESALLQLYSQLHGAGSRYSSSERTLLTKRKGYACYPGGLSPLLRAVQFIRPETIVADLGAGNGLQGLLLQCMCPHRKTIQIEISSELIRVGHIFQQALGINADRVKWIHDDIIHSSIEEADFIYLYLPAKPLDGGTVVYEAIARKLISVKKPLVIFSVADCLAKFLDRQFSVFYSDGHLTCFTKQ
jgi:hypothetical protein